VQAAVACAADCGLAALAPMRAVTRSVDILSA